jgi:hypothetical protein
MWSSVPKLLVFHDGFGGSFIACTTVAFMPLNCFTDVGILWQYLHPRFGSLMYFHQVCQLSALLSHPNVRRSPGAVHISHTFSGVLKLRGAQGGADKPNVWRGQMGRNGRGHSCRCMAQWPTLPSAPFPSQWWAARGPSIKRRRQQVQKEINRVQGHPSS